MADERSALVRGDSLLPLSPQILAFRLSPLQEPKWRVRCVYPESFHFGGISKAFTALSLAGGWSRYEDVDDCARRFLGLVLRWCGTCHFCPHSLELRHVNTVPCKRVWETQLHGLNCVPHKLRW